MKITKDLIVKIDDAEFVFSKPDAKQIEEFSRLQRDGDFNSQLLHVMSTLKSVTGVTDDNGKAIAPGEILDMTLPYDFIVQLYREWNIALTTLISGKRLDPEKKD